MNQQHSSCGIRRAGLLLSGAALYYVFLHPQLRKWGTRLGEAQRRLPGDERIPAPNFDLTYAVNIDAPPEAVWPWIAQMGRERTGYYGLDLITNQGIPSVTFIRQDLQPPEVGQAMDGGFQVMDVESNHRLLCGGFDLERMAGVVQDATLLYLLERRSDGSTRLLVRYRGFTYGTLGPLVNLLVEPLFFAFMRQQLGCLKGCAQRMDHLRG